MRLGTKSSYSMSLMVFFVAHPSNAEIVETVYPATICDTDKLYDDNSQNAHIDNGSIILLEISAGSSAKTTRVDRPIPRNKPHSNGRVRIDIYLLRDCALDVECLFRNTRRNGTPVASIFKGYEAGDGPTGKIRLTGYCETSRRNGTFGVACTFAANNDITFYTFRVREYQVAFLQVSQYLC